MRKSRAKVRVLPGDPKFGDPLVTRFVNTMMWDGKKGKVLNIFYEALEHIERIAGESGYELWKKALDNVTPVVEVSSKRIGGATFQIPSEIHPHRKVSLGMKWIIREGRKRSGKSMAEKLAAEILSASKGEGGAFKRKEDTHRMADANKAFAHFRV